MPDDVDTDPVGSGPAAFAVLLRAFRERGLLTQRSSPSARG
jgi:hypothetical protein